MKPARVQRLVSSGLDAPLSADEIRRKAIERQIKRFGRVIDPALQEGSSSTKTSGPIKKLGPAIVCQRSDADVDVLELVFPMPPDLANRSNGKSRHWYTLHDEKKAYWRRLDELQLVGLLPKPQRREIERGTIRSTMTLGARMDEDNAVARHKWVIDWLATRGYVRNDRLLKWEKMPDQIIKRGAEYSIAITVTRTSE